MYLEYYPKKSEVKQYVKAYFPSNEKARHFAELCAVSEFFLLAKVLHSVCVKADFNPYYTDDYEKIRTEVERLYAQAVNVLSDGCRRLTESSEESSDGE